MQADSLPAEPPGKPLLLTSGLSDPLLPVSLRLLLWAVGVGLCFHNEFIRVAELCWGRGYGVGVGGVGEGVRRN